MSLRDDLFRLLRQMDEEADTRIRGLRTGLVDYAGHLGIEARTYEVPIYRRLAQLLEGLGYRTRTEVRYPDGSGRICDLRATTPEGDDLWLEAKLVWREWVSTASGGVKSANFDGYILDAGASGRSHSLAQDFRKLEELQRHAPGASAAVLAIAFDAERARLDEVILRMQAAEELERRSWTATEPDVWSDRNSPRHRIACWLWTRAAKAAERHGAARPAPSPAPDRTMSLDDWSRLFDRVEDEGFLERSAAAMRAHLARGVSWEWEELIADVLALPLHHELIRAIGRAVRKQEAPYAASKYGSDARLREFLLERLRPRIRDALHARRPAAG